MISGYEAYIRPDPDFHYDVFAPEIHMNLFAKNPKELPYVGYYEKACKYIKDPEMRAALKKVGPEGMREYTVEYVNEFIRAATENGYLVSYNHPVWSLEEEERVLSYEGIFSLEIDNFSAHQINGMEHNGALYDKMLRQGKRIFCHGADDNHNKYPDGHPESDSYGAYTMILAEELTYSAILESMEKGNLYASTGPRIQEISAEGNTIRVKTSPAARIVLFDGSKSTRRAVAPCGETISEAEFTLSEKAKYFRISVVDEKGGRASSRGYFRDEWN